MVSRRQIEAYLQHRADVAIEAFGVISGSKEFRACAEMARVLLDADAVEVDRDGKVTIKGGRYDG